MPTLLGMVLLEAITYSVAVYGMFRLFRVALGSELRGFIASAIYWAIFLPVPGHFYFGNLAVCFVVFAVYLMWTGNYDLAVPLWLISVLFKEYFALVSGVVGLMIFLKTRKWSGLLLTGLSLSFFLLSFFVVMPWAQPRNPNVLIFGYLGSSTGEIAKNVFLDPPRWLGRLVNPVAFKYLAGLVAPFALMGLLVPELIVPALPILGLNILLPSDHGIDQVLSHYTIPWLPLFAAAGMLGIRRFWTWSRSSAAWFRSSLRMAILVAVIANVFFGVRYHLYCLKRAFVGHAILARHTEDVRASLVDIPDKSPS
jgi:uncharacterized membrane protein